MFVICNLHILKLKIKINNFYIMDNDEIVCNCMQITKGEIVDAIKAGNLKTIDEVGDANEAGTICGSCHDDIEDILKEVNG
jgi:NAD(P)H-nitrite reductase large subunit